MYQEYRNGDFVVSTDPSRLDIDAIHAFLSEKSYWAEGRPRAVVARALAHSLCFGMYEREQQIGLARVISDYATYAYLCDVYILESYRGRGLAKWLLRCVLAHPDLQELRRFMLATRDAHGLYRQFGWTELQDPRRHMERVRQNAPQIASPPKDGEKDGSFA